MTRKILIISFCIAFLTVPSSLFAFSYVESISNLGINAPGNNYVSTINFTDGYVGWLHTATWGHSLSSDFMSVPDQFSVRHATLEITGWRAFGVGLDLVKVGGKYQWTDYGGWAWVSQTDNMFDLTHMNSSFWNYSPLTVSMTPIFDYGLLLESSVLSVDYDSVGGQGTSPSPVPEPATLVLFAFGLVATGFVRYRRKTNELSATA